MKALLVALASLCIGVTLFVNTPPEALLHIVGCAFIGAGIGMPVGVFAVWMMS